MAACSPLDNENSSEPDAGSLPDMIADQDDDAYLDYRRKHGIGESCDGPLDCVSDSLCVGTQQMEPFLCMAQCDVPNTLCTDGSVCVSISSDQTAICYIGGNLAINDPCESNLECAPGSLCFGAAEGEETRALCRPACSESASAACENNEYCLSAGTSALCRTKLGSRCSDDSTCQDPTLSCSPNLSPDLEIHFPGGACTKECTTDAECAALGGVCRTLFSTGISVCIPTCEHNGDCRFYEDYGCNDASICDGRVDEEACQDTFQASRLCVHEYVP